MDASRFDRLVRSLSTGSSRRGLLRLAATSLGIGVAVHVPAVARAKKKIKKNEFGCVNVGNKCRGKDGKCCSGICQGKKPKKDEKDKSKCQAHDTGTGCVAGQQSPFCRTGEVIAMGLHSEGEPPGQCTTSTGFAGVCQTTTGNAPYCARDDECFRCTKDTECELVCGPGAVCARCVGCDEEGGTACLGPNPGSCEISAAARHARYSPRSAFPSLPAPMGQSPGALWTW
jgi:hypothetical protein